MPPNAGECHGSLADDTPQPGLGFVWSRAAREQIWPAGLSNLERLKLVAHRAFEKSPLTGGAGAAEVQRRQFCQQGLSRRSLELRERAVAEPDDAGILLKRAFHEENATVGQQRL